ncbi:Ionotropic receptor 75a [Anthophora retusa]
MFFLARIFPWLFVLPFAFAFAFDSSSSLVRLIDDMVTVLLPPVMLSAHLCHLGEDDVVELSRRMSRKGLQHEIHQDLEEFATRTHDTWEHKTLYVLDLDCDYAFSLLKSANGTGMFMAPIKWLLIQDRATVSGNSTRGIEETFKDMAVYPDSEVILARRVEAGNSFTEITSVYRPSPFRGVIVENRGNWTSDGGVRLVNFHAASRRRKDLLGTPLKSCLVMTDPDTINHLTDYENKHIDPVTKANYPWILHIVSRMNATVSFRISNTWGYQGGNGSWSGMTGMLQRREIDIGGTGTFFIAQRIGVVDYVQLYTHTRSAFIFRQPLLSTVSNIFTLPFQRSVWIAIGILLLMVLALLHFTSKWEFHRGASSATAKYWQQFNPAEQTLSDNFMVVLGAVAQQGYSYEPYRVSPRIVTLMLLIAALSLYTSYTANIVALLQSTTDSIQTLTDLFYSPLKLGAQDVVYSRYYFKSFDDSIRRAIVDQKIEPKGQNSSWMTIQEGVHRVRNELFALHAERGTAYKIMQETYLEEEKCGITELDFIKVLYPLLVVQFRSPYLEIVKNTALLLRETGLKFREEYRLYTEKPQCQGQTGFVSIGFTECYFALLSMGYGTLLSLVVLALELFCQKRCESIDFASTMIAPFRDKTTESDAAAWKHGGSLEPFLGEEMFSNNADQVFLAQQQQRQQRQQEQQEQQEQQQHM